MVVNQSEVETRESSLVSPLSKGGCLMKESTKLQDSVAFGIGKTFRESIGLNSNPDLTDVNLKHFVTDPEGTFIIDGIRKRLVGEWDYKNLVTNAGKASVAGLMLTDVAGTAYDYIAIGTGTTAAAATDTTLETEIASGGGSRAAGTGTRVTTTVTNDTAQLQVTFSFTSSFAVTESGMFNASSSGTMLTRRVFSAINVANGDSLQVTWRVAVA